MRKTVSKVDRKEYGSSVEEEIGLETDAEMGGAAGGATAV